MSEDNATDLRQLAWQTFVRELPKLYAERPEQWVAYKGDQVLGFNAQEHLLYQECYRMGLKDDEFLIVCIVPHDDEIWMGPYAID